MIWGKVVPIDKFSLPMVNHYGSFCKISQRNKIRSISHFLGAEH